MLDITALPAFQPLVVCSVLLILKMGAVAFATANARRKSRIVLNPEDTRVNPGSRAAVEEASATLRTKRALLNDVENIPGFLVLALLLTLTGCSAGAGWAYFGIYSGARAAHTICYLNGLQPWRTAAFFTGQLAQLGVMIQLLMKAL